MASPEFAPHSKIPSDPFGDLANDLEAANGAAVSRRRALSTFGRVAKGVASGNIPEVRRALKDVTSDKEPELQFSETISQATLFALANILSEYVFDKLGIKTGNASRADIEKDIRERPLEALFEGIILTPMIEEMLFRLFPQILAMRSDWKRDEAGEPAKIRWDLGIPVSLIFAGIHNLTSKGFVHDVIPIQSFLGGVFLWKIARERGIDHAVLFHAQHNTVWMMHMLLKQWP